MIDSLYEPFKQWSDGGSIYILSDFHLNDPDCLKMDKNWITPEEQIAIINKTVHKCDTLICLGDVGDRKLAAGLKAGHKVLICGNHDKKHEYVDIFDEIFEGPIFISEKILLSHEPIPLPFCVNIHGHDHACKQVFYEVNGCHMVNLAANVCGYKPYNLKNMIKNGLISKIPDIHRITIDKATEKKLKRNE